MRRRNYSNLKLSNQKTRTLIYIITELGFANDLAILLDNAGTTIKQIEVLKVCDEKVDLKISLEKTKFYDQIAQKKRLKPIQRAY